MGEVGGYQLHLYCDVPDCPRVWDGGVKQPGEFMASTLMKTRTVARKNGWKMGEGNIVTGCDPAWRCPPCVKAGRRVPIDGTPGEAP